MTVGWVGAGVSVGIATGRDVWGGPDVDVVGLGGELGPDEHAPTTNAIAARRIRVPSVVSLQSGNWTDAQSTIAPMSEPLEFDQDLPAHVAANREAWDRYAHEYVEAGERAWATDVVDWGIWSIPESDVHLLPEDVSGHDVIELGCGTAYVSAWLAKRGARPVGVDN